MGTCKRECLFSRTFSAGGLIKHHRLVAVDLYPVLKVASDCSSQNQFLEIASTLDQFLGTVSVTDPGDILFDDWTFVQILGNIVGSGTDELDPTFVGLVVGPGSGKGRKKGVVNIDHWTTDLFEEARREHLHVAGKDEEVDFLLSQPGKLFGFCIRLALPAD